MFERPHHRRIARVLEALDGARFAAATCLFGGGTAIALRHGEYRESVDIDFLVSDRDGYRDLRATLTGRDRLRQLTAAGVTPPWEPEDWRADQYGLRTRLVVDGEPIKFEVVFEARVALAVPDGRDAICGVPALGDEDLACCKLLANADRWTDASVFSRDIIDLAMLDLPPRRMREPFARAHAAYGAAVTASARAASAALRGDPARLRRCLQALKMELPPAQMIARLRTLDRRLATL